MNKHLINLRDSKEKRNIHYAYINLKKENYERTLIANIVEKLAVFETLLKQIIADKNETNQNQYSIHLQALHADIKKMIEQFLLNQNKMCELELKMEAWEERLQQPLKTRIDHKHHLHKGIWIAIALFLISAFLSYKWLSEINKNEQFEANDIKYRALKVTGDRALLKLLYHTDSLYNLDAEHMGHWVLLEEEHLIERTKILQLAGEKKREAKHLRSGPRD